MQYELDRKFGLKNEDIVFDILNEVATNVKKTDRYNIYDYECDKYHYELKSRNIASYVFPTTMLPYNKIKHSKKVNKPVIFLFSFIDGLYFWIEKDTVTYEIKEGGRYRDGKKETSLYAYINCDELIPFKDFVY